MINGFMPDMPAIGESIRSISSGRIERPPQHCPRGQLLRPGRMLVQTHPCAHCCGMHRDPEVIGYFVMPALVRSSAGVGSHGGMLRS
jgi:hypothetical protein